MNGRVDDILDGVRGPVWQGRANDKKLNSEIKELRTETKRLDGEIFRYNGELSDALTKVEQLKAEIGMLKMGFGPECKECGEHLQEIFKEKEQLQAELDGKTKALTRIAELESIKLKKGIGFDSEIYHIAILKEE